MTRLGLGAVRLFDHAVDMERPENGHSAFVVGNDHSVAAQRDVGVIDLGHRILASIGRPNCERNKGHARELFTHLIDHPATLYQKFAPAHHLLAVEPDIEVASDAVDVRFGNPIRAGVFGVGMTKRDVYPRNFFVL